MAIVDQLIEAQVAYVARFGVPAPMPACADDSRVTEVLKKAIDDGAPVPDDFDWWDYLPPGAVA